jgi:hypothetical protein
MSKASTAPLARRGSKLAAEFNARLAGSEALPIVVAWWRAAYHAAIRNGENISSLEMNEAENAAFCLGGFEALLGIDVLDGEPEAPAVLGECGAAYAARLKAYCGPRIAAAYANVLLGFNEEHLTVASEYADAFQTCWSELAQAREALRGQPREG